MATTVFNYQLANTVGYKFSICKAGYNTYDQLAFYNKANFPDIELTRPNTTTDLSLLDSKCLLTVNGYVHPTLYRDGKLYLPQATNSMINSRENNVGILSFNKLTKPLIRTKITSSMISAELPTSMFEKVILTFDHDIGHPILVISGYMIFEHPEFFYRVSGNSFVLRLDRLNYVEKLYELSNYREIFKELEVPTSTVNLNLVDADMVRSDEVITKFLTGFNSFLVEVPVDTLITRKVYLEHSSIPGNFRTEIKPILPVMTGYGKLSEYTKYRSNDTKYTVYTADSHYNNYLFSKLPPDQIKLYNANREVGNIYRLCEAFFLEITGTTND